MEFFSRGSSQPRKLGLLNCRQILYYFGASLSSVGKESICNAGDPGSIPESGRSSGKRKGYPLQYSGLENSMDYSPWGRKESDTTEWLSLSLSLFIGVRKLRHREVKLSKVTEARLLIWAQRIWLQKVDSYLPVYIAFEHQFIKVVPSLVQNHLRENSPGVTLQHTWN